MRWNRQRVAPGGGNCDIADRIRSGEQPGGGPDPGTPGIEHPATYRDGSGSVHPGQPRPGDPAFLQPPCTERGGVGVDDR